VGHVALSVRLVGLGDSLEGAAGKRGAQFVAFNADTEYVRQLYGDWAQIYEMEERRNVNAKGDGRGVVGTVLITNMEE